LFVQLYLVLFRGERLNRQVDTGQHPAMLQNPPADWFVAGISQDAIGQHNPQAATLAQPLDRTLDEENLGRDRVCSAIARDPLVIEGKTRCGWG
jgi:hypothetical protein